MINKIIFGCILFNAGLISAQQVPDSIQDLKKDSAIISTGYLSQSLESVSGAVSTVSRDELEKSPVSTLSEALIGRLYGRGLCNINGSSPLIVVDGMITPDPIWNFITPAEIESVSLLKDASTTSIYGIQGANSVLVINTRRGYMGKVKVNLSVDHAFQQMTHKPNVVSSAEYATLRNQAAFNDDNSRGLFSMFSQEQIDAYAAGSDPRYPDNDFYGMMVRKLTSFQRVNLSVSGGNKNVSMFSNVNVLNQNPFFIQGKTKYKDQADYDVGLFTRWINYRTNLDFTFNKFLTGFLRLNGNVSFNKQPGSEYFTNSQGVDSPVSNSIEDIYASLFSLAPTRPGPLTPDGEILTSPVSTSYPAYGRINRTGYNSTTSINNLAQTGLNLDLGFITEGLSLTGSMAYFVNSMGVLQGKKTYERWQLNESVLDSLVFTRYGSWNNKPLSFSKSASSSSYIASNVFLKYDRDIGSGKIAAMSYMNFQKLDFELFPSYRVNYGLSVQYGLNDKYFLKADAAYSGSEQFAPENRFTFTPSVAAAWVLSKESFLESIAWIDYLKVRTSYGLSANDRGISQYLYADKLNIVNGGYSGDLAYTIRETRIGYPDLSAEILKSFNFGTDLEFLNHWSVSVDYFHQKMDNMLINGYGLVPWYIGYSSATFPRTNMGKVRNHGVDANLSYQAPINSRMDFFSSLIITYNRNKVLESGQVDNPDSYFIKNYQNGYSIGQDFGYKVDYSGPGNGFYSSDVEIYNSGLDFQIGTPRPGDLKFTDLNEDGIINEKDKDVIGNGSLPRINFGLSLGTSYMSPVGLFDFSCLLQGVAWYKVYIDLNESLYEGVFSDMHMNAWTQEKYDAGERDFDYPALSLKSSYSQNRNDFFMMNGSYLRLKNLVVGYTVPESLARKFHLDNLRVYLSGQNLLSINGLKTRNIDPETRNLYTFQVFRVMNLGLNLSF